MKRFLRDAPVAKHLCWLLCASLLFLSGCSSIRVRETWKQPATPAQPYGKLMVLAVWLDENRRAIAEDIIVEELGSKGVTAIASHTAMTHKIEQATRDDVVAAVRKSGADAVLTIRGVARGDGTVSQDGQREGIYGTATNMGGSYLAGARDYSRATLQSNLYDSATAELVWSATIATFDADNEIRVSRDLAGYYLKKLRSDGFL